MRSSPLTHPGLFPALLLASVAPPLLAYNLTPSATLFNQLLALAAWGGVLALSDACGFEARAQSAHYCW